MGWVRRINLSPMSTQTSMMLCAVNRGRCADPPSKTFSDLAMMLLMLVNES